MSFWQLGTVQHCLSVVKRVWSFMDCVLVTLMMMMMMLQFSVTVHYNVLNYRIQRLPYTACIHQQTKVIIYYIIYIHNLSSCGEWLWDLYRSFIAVQFDFIWVALKIKQQPQPALDSCFIHSSLILSPLLYHVWCKSGLFSHLDSLS